MNPVLVIGTAPGWRDDVRVAVGLLRRKVRCPWDVCAVNYAGIMHLDPIQHWVSIHGAEFEWWIPKRQERGGNLDFRAYSTCPTIPEGDEWWQAPPNERNGTSGMLAVIYMHRLGYQRIILAGVHLMGLKTDHEGKDDNRPTGYEHHQRSWERWAPEFKQYTRSIAGYTATLLGEPTVEWIREGLDVSTAPAA